jgi:hypothetical protein
MGTKRKYAFYKIRISPIYKRNRKLSEATYTYNSFKALLHKYEVYYCREPL